VGKDGRITLDLEPEVSDVTTDNKNTSSGDPKGIYTAPMPVVTRRHARTVVHVDDGQTVVIGGLLMEQSRSIVDKVPVAGDIPGVGAPFRNVRGDKQQQEVVILITANIVGDAKPEHERLAARLEHKYVTPLDALAAPAGGFLDLPDGGEKSGATAWAAKPKPSALKRLYLWIAGEGPR
jgi:type II secretory pathway component GspD/PulD (secretin)